MTGYHSEHQKLTQCQQCSIRHCGLCKILTSEELIQLETMALFRSYTAGQVIRFEEEPVIFYANVVSGILKVYKSISDGRRQIVGFLFTASLIDDLFSDKAHVSIEAVTDVILCVYPKQAFESLVSMDNKLERKLFKSSLKELSEAQNWMLLLGRKTATEKVASFFLWLAERSSTFSSAQVVIKPADTIFQIPGVRADIADYLGLTSETVCRQITKLKKNQVIDVFDNNNTFLVKDHELLSELSGE